MNKTGQIDISELTIPPEKHELYTAKFFAQKGKDITFIRPSNIKGNYKADFVMDGKIWEVKSPIGKSKRISRTIFGKHHCGRVISY